MMKGMKSMETRLLTRMDGVEDTVDTCLTETIGTVGQLESRIKKRVCYGWNGVEAEED